MEQVKKASLNYHNDLISVYWKFQKQKLPDNASKEDVLRRMEALQQEIDLVEEQNFGTLEDYEIIATWWHRYVTDQKEKSTEEAFEKAGVEDSYADFLQELEETGESVNLFVEWVKEKVEEKNDEMRNMRERNKQ